MSFLESARWQWRWTEMCGADGFEIWSHERHDLGICFQQLFLQIPALALLAITSAYFIGRCRNDSGIIRGPLQKRAICIRAAFICFFFVFCSYFQALTLMDQNSSVPRTEISVFLTVVEIITWIIHGIYIACLREHFGPSPRGPVQIVVLWTIVAVLSVINLHSYYLLESVNADQATEVKLGFSIVRVVLHVGYGATLLPGPGAEDRILSDESDDEETPLLGNNDFSRFREEEDPYYLGVAMEDTSFLSRLLFYWVNPLMRKGTEKRLNHSDDLYDLPFELSCGSVGLKLDKALIGNVDEVRRIEQQNAEPEVSFSNVKRHNVSLFRALHKCFWFQFYSIGVLKFLADCAGFAGPLLLNKLVGFIEDQNEDIQYGYLYAGGLFLTSLIGALCNAHFSFYMSMVGLKIRSALVSTIYRKTLTVGATELNSAFSVGELVNFMSTDADRIVNSCPSFHALWSIPFQLAITLYLLYAQVGLAFLAGVAFTVLLIPINKFIASKIGELSAKLMEKKDERVKMMTETLRGIRTIKLHVWESHFIYLITSLRVDELKYLKGRKYLDALCVYFWATTPVLISILTFGTYVLLGNKLTAATVFTAMALLNMLIGPLNAFPWVLNGVTEAWVSIKRVQRLFDLPDLDLDSYYDGDIAAYSTDTTATHIQITGANFSWGKTLSAVGTSSVRPRRTRDKGKRKKSARDEGDGDVSTRNTEEGDNDERREFYLGGINLNVQRGQFVGVIGQVGSGKSSLLAGILAEVSKHEGSIFVTGLPLGFGFVTQQPWLQRGTIRDNILFGKAFDDERYRTVLFVCGLAEDIHLFPAGDLTAIGEGGATLSGGQKARVALARAVYQDMPIYLLDDVMSAVDRNVAKHIYEHCIMNYLSAKTRILCTHHTQYLVDADHIVVLEEGRVVQQGKPSEVLQDFEDYFLPSDVEHSQSTETGSNLLESLSKEVAPSKVEDTGSILNEEGRATGSIEAGVYGAYWKAVGSLLSICILMSMVLMQTSRNMTDWWLSYWVSHSPHSNTSNSSLNDVLSSSSSSAVLYLTGKDGNDLNYYLMVYGLFAGSNTVFTLFRAFLFAYGGLVAASKLHKLLLKTIIKAEITFFDVSPLGRILNRFSSDTYTIDDSLPFIMNILFAQIFGTVGAVAITIYGLPWLCLVLAPLVPIYLWLQNNYRLTSRELKRLSSVTLSPVYSHFNETLQGLPTVRALRATQRFNRDNMDNVEANVKAQFASFAAAQWLGLRLQFIGVALISGVGVIAVVKHQYDVVDPGLIGLAISYALSITSLLSGVVNSFTETEREMIAVERVNQYIEEVEEEGDQALRQRGQPVAPYGWPFQGVVTFDSVVMQYRDHLPPSLTGVTFETRPAEKVGVVGRTGAGKSSLFAALFRLVELRAGAIRIDNVNIANMDLESLRSNLWIIPQEPFLFSGTVRENLDPVYKYRDRDLWSALARVNMTPTIRRLGGLHSLLGSSGCNLSSGQRQLLCLARAILYNPKILCIDEATANVDKETDRQIQQTIRSSFQHCTVITIAHRVQTVLDYDRVLVMDNGQVAEFDSPNNLLADSNSRFYKLVNQET